MLRVRQEDVKKFEENMLIEKTDTLEDVVSQLLDAFYYELDEIDERFSLYADLHTFDK